MDEQQVTVELTESQAETVYKALSLLVRATAEGTEDRLNAEAVRRVLDPVLAKLEAEKVPQKVAGAFHSGAGG